MIKVTSALRTPHEESFPRVVGGGCRNVKPWDLQVAVPTLRGRCSRHIDTGRRQRPRPWPQGTEGPLQRQSETKHQHGSHLHCS